MNSDPSVTCALCRNELNIKFDISDYIKHVRLFHAYKPDFKITCGINGCLRSYTNLGTFKNHVSAVHSTADYCNDVVAVRNDESFNTYSDQNLDSSDDNSESDNLDFSEDGHSTTNNVTDINIIEKSCSDSLTCSKEILQKSSALFLLGLKEKYKLTQVELSKVLQVLLSSE